MPEGRKTSKNSGKPINLALQGGGSHGALTWGVLGVEGFGQSASLLLNCLLPTGTLCPNSRLLPSFAVIPTGPGSPPLPPPEAFGLLRSWALRAFAELLPEALPRAARASGTQRWTT